MRPQLLFLTAFLSLCIQTGCARSRNDSTAQGTSPHARATANLPRIMDFPNLQVTGITVANDGRMFANFPRWRDGVPFSVVEIKADGSYLPYPDQNWNAWTGQPRPDSFTCVQSVVAHGDSLFVLDPSNPQMKGVVGHPTLFEFDLKTNQLKHKWEFSEAVAPPRSYLNDLRVDDKLGQIYITESGLGALIVLDLKSGQSHRLLAEDPSTKSEILTLVTNGKPLVKTNGNPQRLHADGIALSGDYLYYHAVSGRHLYRIPTSSLANPKLASADVAKSVEDLGITPSPDGMIFDSRGNLYMADLEHNAVVYRTPTGQIHVLVQDPNLDWADTFTIDPAGNLVFTDSELDQAIPGNPATGITTHIYRIPLAK